MASEWKNQFTARGLLAELKSPVFWRDVLLEGLATITLMTFVMFLLISNNEEMYKHNTTHIGLAAGFLIFVIVEGYAPLSGCNINPAVSIALAAVGKMTCFRAVVYVAVQICGAAAAAGIGYALTPYDKRDSFSPILPAESMTDLQSVLVEACLTFNLLFVIMSLIDKRRPSPAHLPGLTIGFAIGIGALVAGTHTGGLLNPLVSFSPAIVSGDFSKHWIYWVGPVLGGVLGAVTYQFAQWIKFRFSPKPQPVDAKGEYLDVMAKKEELTQLLNEILKNSSSSVPTVRS